MHPDLPGPVQLGGPLPFREKARRCWPFDWRGEAGRALVTLREALAVSNDTSQIVSRVDDLEPLFDRWLCRADDLCLLLDGL